MNLGKTEKQRLAQIVAVKKYREKNRERFRLYARKNFEARRAFVNSLKDNPCMDCNQKFPAACMEFDHRPGTQKHAAVSSLTNSSLETLQKEIDKCDLVCANCHRIRTQKRLSKQ